MAAVRAGAVVVALGALVFFVVRAQTNANVDAAAPGASDESPLKLPDTFLPSSKSEAIVIIEDGAQPAPAKKSEHFLRSSKSLSFDSGTPVPKLKQPVAKPKKKPAKDVFLPSSKSMPVPVAPPDGK